MLANSPSLWPRPVKSKRRTAMPCSTSASAMRLAAKMSLPQVKQWANSAYARAGPSGESSRAASLPPCDPGKDACSLFTGLRSRAPRSQLSAVRRRLVRALQELQQRAVRIRRGAHRFVGQDELARLGVVAGGRRPTRAGGVALRLGIGIRVEGRFVDRPAAGPEARAAALLRVRLHHHVVRAVRRAARMSRGRAAGEARDRQVEAAPEEVHGALLAVEAAAEALEDAVRLDHRAPPAVHGVAVIGRVLFVLGERDRRFHLDRPGEDLRLEAKRVQCLQVLRVEAGHRSGGPGRSGACRLRRFAAPASGRRNRSPR